MKRLAYSTDNENFNFDSFGELLDYQLSEFEDVIGMEYYSIEVSDVNLSDYLSADWILQCADDYLYDDIHNEDGWNIFDGVSEQAKSDLNDYLKFWASQHTSKHSIYKCVGKSTKHIITEEDLLW